MTRHGSATRRAVLRGGAAAVGLTGSASIAGCAGLTSRESDTQRGSGDLITFQTYGTDAEARQYAELASAYQRETGVRVSVKVVPFQEMFTGIDSGLLSGTAPDVFRVDYPTMGLYASTDQLLDVTDALDELAGDVPPALMNAVSQAGRFYGVPQHVDTSAVVYRPDVLRDAGVGAVPDRPEDAWSWEEFGDVAQRVTDAAPAGNSAFAVNWQAAGAFRWLNWLFMAGGHLYTEDLTSCTVDDAAGRRALDFTTSFFERGWVPGTTSTKAASYPDTLFTAGTLSMIFAGNFLLPTFADTIGRRFEYAATYLPQDARRASELGGNAIVATKNASNPDLATDFLVYLASKEAMSQFCAECTLLPTRASIDASTLDFAVGGDLMPVYGDQITTIAPRDVADVTTPTFAEVNVDLANELEASFLSGRSVDESLQALREQVDATTSLNKEAAG